jgi:hypothetical protein
MTIARKYGLPIGLGLIGMFICHFFILIGFGSRVQYPIYAFTYPVVYPLIAAALIWRNVRHWVTDAILVNAVPLLYWYLLLWGDGRVSFEAALRWRASSGMLLIMPVTIGLTLVVSFILSRFRGKPQTQTESQTGASGGGH